jgi:hypothetical protein
MYPENVPIVGNNLVKPSDIFIRVVAIISKITAENKKIHSIIMSFLH